MSTKCDKRGLAHWCTDVDVKLVQRRTKAAGVQAGCEYNGDKVYMCIACRTSNGDRFKIIKAALA